MTNRSHRLVAALTVLALVLTVVPAVTALAAPDIEGHWAQDAIEQLVEVGAVSGLPDGTFRPDLTVTRSEFVTMVNKSLGITPATGSSRFKDVKPDDWFAGQVGAAAIYGYVAGNPDGTFDPYRPITREQAAAMLVRAFGLSKLATEAQQNAVLASFIDDDKVSVWAKADVATAVSLGLLSGYTPTTLAPQPADLTTAGWQRWEGAHSTEQREAVLMQLGSHGLITRGQIAAVLVRALALEPEIAVSVFDKAGTYGPEEGIETISGDVIVKADGVTLQNLIITDDLIIDDSVGDGTVVLENVTVKGDTEVKGGGTDSVIFRDCTLHGTVTVEKVDGKIRIVAEGSTSVPKVALQTGAILISQDDGLFEWVELPKDLAKGTEVVLTGNFAEVEIAAKKANVTVGEGSTIDDLVLSKNATGTQVDLDKKASVNTVTAGAKVEITGQGSIAKAEINISGVVIEQKPDKVVLAEGVKANIAGKDVPESKKSTGGGGPSKPTEILVSAINITTDIDVAASVDNGAKVKVTLTTATSSADIYYTTDGTTPTASSTKYSVPFIVDTDNTAGETITIKAIGIKAGYKNSAVAEKEIVFKPASISVTEISVSSNPAKITYYEGESLNLTGLRVKLIYSDDSEETVELTDFAAKGITTDPVNGTSLTIAEHNDKNIVVSYNDKSAQSSGKLSVSSKSVVNIAAVPGVTAPVKEAAPVTAITTTDQYTGTVSWAPAIVGDKFAAGTAYTATITLTPKIGYTLTGVSENFFTIAGAATVTNAANSGIITAVFPATESSEFAGGDGTPGNPYQVATAGQLDNVRYHLDKYFIQTADIDLKSYLSVGGEGYNGGAGWIPIGERFYEGIPEKPNFTGNYNGGGFTISNLMINSPSSYVGLFGESTGTISNLSLTGVNVKGKNYVGGLMGSNHGGTVTNCNVIGDVGLYEEYGSYIGGLIGVIKGGSTLSCYSKGTVSAKNGINVGGLIGKMEEGFSSDVIESYSTSNVTGGTQVGGLVGANIPGEAGGNNITNSYATGSVSQDISEGNTNHPQPSIGGLVGYNAGAVTNSYAIGRATGPGGSIGGLIGEEYNYTATVFNSYWDTITSGQVNSTGGSGKTTDEMKDQTTFIDWDFGTVWGINSVDNEGYPFLRWQGYEHIPDVATKPVTDVSLNKSSLELFVRESETLIATVAPADATDKDVVWSSDNLAVATVDSTGKVTAVAAGTATITVTSEEGGFTDTVTITVVDPTYAITYDGNGNTSGTVPIDENEYGENKSVTVLGNSGSLEKTGYTFAGWNTQADGQGTGYQANDTFNIATNTTLYAIWKSSSANLISVAGQTDNSPGGGTGEEAVTWQVNVDNAKATLALADIVVADGATFRLFADMNYTTEIEGEGTLALNVGNTIAYIRVDAEDGTTIKFYEATVKRLPAQSGSPEFTSGRPATYGTQLTVGTGTLTTITNLRYWWHRSVDEVYDASYDSPVFGSSTMAYTPVAADIGYYLIVVVVTPNASGSAILVTDAPVAKAGSPAFTAEYAGTFPVEATSINLTGLGASAGNLEASVAIDGTNYADYADLMVDGDGKAVITGLVGVTASTKVKVRVKETTTHKAGADKEITVTEK